MPRVTTARTASSAKPTARGTTLAKTALDKSKAFAKLRSDDAGKALVSLFCHPKLPGTTAQDRTRFVLDYTQSSNKLVQFRVEFSDVGFRADMRDSVLYDSGKSNQVGHFLTAVRLGFKSNAGPMRYLAELAAVGHELTSDGGRKPRFPTWTLLTRTAAQVIDGALNPGKVKLFDSAVEKARAGDRDGVKKLVEQILPDVPWMHEPWNLTGGSHWTDAQGKEQVGREGNSRQDMLLTAYGVALGSMIRERVLKTPDDVANWLKSNVTV